jgi:hypothetical protein
LSFFEYYSLELQKQKQQKQQAAKKKTKERAQKGVIIKDQEHDLYPSQDVNPPAKNPEKQPALKQFAIFVISPEESSSSDQEQNSPCSSVDNDLLIQQDSIETQSSCSDLHSSWSTDEECADLTEIFMADPQPSRTTDPQPSTTTEPQVSEIESDTVQTHQPPLVHSEGSQKPSNGGPYFTIDDLSSLEERQERLNEFRAVIAAQLAQGVSLQNSLLYLCSRFKGSLGDWYAALGAYRQLQLIQMGYAEFLGLLYTEFVGNVKTMQNQNQSEFYKRKCCSLKSKDINAHIMRMSRLYYLLDGPNNPALKRVFFTSFP